MKNTETCRICEAEFTRKDGLRYTPTCRYCAATFVKGLLTPSYWSAALGQRIIPAKAV